MDNKLSTYFPYVLPFALFALLTYSGSLMGIPVNLAYPAKTVIVGLCLVCFRDSYRAQIRLDFNWIPIVTGLCIFMIWIGLEGFYPQPGMDIKMSLRFSDNPLFIIFRFIGAVIIVPVMEELFWRSFAMRFLIDFKFWKIRLGEFTWFSFIVISLAFGFEHHEWLPGIIAGAAYAGLLYRSRNLFSPILAHAVTNLFLGVYVIFSGRYEFW